MPTEFPNCESRLRPILDGYLKYVREWTKDGEWFPFGRTKSEWHSGARSTAEALAQWKVPENDWHDYAYWACTVMERDGLDNKTPRSIGYLARKWKTAGDRFSEASRMRYLEGDL